ncbi:MAG: helix-turn-helix domain-containing protein [Flavisolibacter sp.]
MEAIQSFINEGIEESLHLDYKAGDALQKTDSRKKEVSKDISAMANSAGGTIIYGIREFASPGKRHLPEKLDPVDRSEFTREWLEQVINSNIQPKIDGVTITPVTIDGSEKVVYVLDIPQSGTAHQAADKRYYKRYNFESVAMEDYEIRDVMSRLKTPLLTLEFVLEKKLRIEKDPISGGPMVSMAWQKREPKTWTEYMLKVAIRNEGKIFANYVNYYLEIDQAILYKADDWENAKDKPGMKVIYGENTVREVVDVQHIIHNVIKKYGPSRFDPVLPGTRSRYETIRLANDLTSFNFPLRWIIYADNAEPRIGEISLLTAATIEET